MKRQYDIVYAVALVLFLVAAVFIGNSILKGILLLLFSSILMTNTILQLKAKQDDGFTKIIFYGILLFLNSVLTLGSIYVIISAVKDVF